MSLTVTRLIFQSGGCLLTTMRPRFWRWWACSCLSTTPRYSALATSSDVRFIATTHWFSCGPCISPSCRTGRSLIPIDLDVCSVSTVVHHRFFNNLDTQYRPPISRIIISHWVTISCLGTSVGVFGVSVLVTWQLRCYTSVSSFWALYTLILQRGSHLLVSRSRDNYDAYSISLFFLVLLSATTFHYYYYYHQQHFIYIASHTHNKNETLFSHSSLHHPHTTKPHIFRFYAWRLLSG